MIPPIAPAPTMVSPMRPIIAWAAPRSRGAVAVRRRGPGESDGSPLPAAASAAEVHAADGRVGEELRRRRGVADLAEVQHEATVGELERLPGILLDEQD